MKDHQIYRKEFKFSQNQEKSNLYKFYLTSGISGIDQKPPTSFCKHDKKRQKVHRPIPGFKFDRG